MYHWKHNFNAQGLNTNWYSLSSMQELGKLFLDTVLDNIFMQVANKLTRGKNIVDLALVGDASTVIDVEHSFGSNDHKMVNETGVRFPKSIKHNKVYLYIFKHELANIV